MSSKFPFLYSVFQTITEVAIHFCTHTRSCYKIAGVFEISLIGVQRSYLGVTGFSILGDSEKSDLELAVLCSLLLLMKHSREVHLTDF